MAPPFQGGVLMITGFQERIMSYNQYELWTKSEWGNFLSVLKQEGSLDDEKRVSGNFDF